MLVLADQFEEYLHLIDGKVIYAEDHVFRLMMYRNEPASWFPQCPVLYEVGTGISTSGSAVWAERLRKDWLAANEIMAEWMDCSNSFDKRLLRVMDGYGRDGNRSLREKILWYLFRPRSLLERAKRKMQGRRMSPIVHREDFLKDISTPLKAQ